MSRLGIAFQSDKTLSEYRRLADVVSRYDFDTVSVYQDLFYQPPWPALFQFAERTETPLLGAAVTNPYLNHPVLVAGHLAMLDEASAGRAYLGVGRGAFFEAIGVPQPRPVTAMREMVESVQRLLAGDRSPYAGEMFTATEDAYLRWPIPRRRLPVVVGGWGELVVGLAAKIADRLKVGGTVNPAIAPSYKEKLAVAGRKVRLVFGAVTVVDRDRDAAEALARERVAMYVPVVARLDPSLRGRADELDPSSMSREMLRKLCCFGTPSDVIEQLEALFGAGVDAFELGAPHGVDEGEAIRLLGEEVLPRFI